MLSTDLSLEGPDWKYCSEILRYWGKHCVFYHRYRIVWSTKCRRKVLFGDLRLRIREIIRQVCAEYSVEIVRGVLSSDQVQLFVSEPAKLAISDLVRKMKGRSSRKAQQEFPQSADCFRGNGSGAGVYFSATNGHRIRRRSSVSGKAHPRSYRHQPIVV